MHDANKCCPTGCVPFSQFPVPDGLCGPRDRLAKELEKNGLIVAVDGDLFRLRAFNKSVLSREPDAWFPLLPTPRSAPSFWLDARDGQGATVGCYASVSLDCRSKSFGERIGDLTAFYDAPADEAPKDWARCASAEALGARGRVAWMSAGWLAPAWRGRPRRFHLLGRVARLTALALWNPDWMGGLVDPDVVPVWARAKGPYRIEMQSDVVFYQHGVGLLPMHVCGADRAAVLAEFSVQEQMSGREHDALAA